MPPLPLCATSSISSSTSLKIHVFISEGRRAVFAFEQCWHPVTGDWGRGCGGWKGGARLLLSYRATLPLFFLTCHLAISLNLVLSSVLSERGSLKYQTPTPLEGNSQIFHQHQWRLSHPILFIASCASSSQLPACHRVAQYSLKQTHKHIQEQRCPSVNAQINGKNVATHRSTHTQRQQPQSSGIYLVYLCITFSLCVRMCERIYTGSLE